MKFVLHFDSGNFLVCNCCGKEEFKLLPEKKLCDCEKYEPFLFYECADCAGNGFWTHRNSIDEKRQIGIAIARCKLPATLFNANGFQQQTC